MIIDSHQHFWNLDKIKYSWLNSSFKEIYRNIEPPELIPLLKATGVDRTVLIQAMDSFEETDYMLSQGAMYPWIAGVVGWVPLNDPEKAEKKIREYVKNPIFKGVRHLIHEENNPDWIVQDKVIKGLKVLEKYNLTFDVVAEFPNHLKHVPYIVKQVPNLKIVIDHLAKPPNDTVKIKEWSDDLYKASQHSQIFAKISGLNTSIGGAWSSYDLEQYIEFARYCFGADRLMFGSDWPIANLAGDYIKVWKETNKVLQRYPKQDVEKILGKTAKYFYNI